MWTELKLANESLLGSPDGHLLWALYACPFVYISCCPEEPEIVMAPSPQ